MSDDLAEVPWILWDDAGRQWRVEHDKSARTREDRNRASYTVEGVTYDHNDRPIKLTPLYRLVPREDTDE